MKTVITYGTHDLLHQGHINLLRRAKELGDWLIVGVTTDKFDLERGKMNSYDNLMERIEAVRSTGYADQIIIEEYKGQKIDDIRKYGVDIFAIGSDWEGYFDYLKEFCEVVYLPRTEGISSTLLRGERPSVKVGVIGSETAGRPFIEEAKVVNSIEIHDNLEECEAVYIASPNENHYRDAKEALAKADERLLEPMRKVETIVPDQYLGDVVGDINARRGRIDNIETRLGEQSVHCFVPLSEMFGYATDLRSRTQGRGMYTMQFDHYEEVPKSVAEKVVGKRD